MKAEADVTALTHCEMLLHVIVDIMKNQIQKLFNYILKVSMKIVNSSEGHMYDTSEHFNRVFSSHSVKVLF